MKRILYFLLAFVLCMLLPLSVSATGDTKDTAEEIITYEGLQARLALDSPGIRSLYTVDQKAVTALEQKGYTVAYGAVMGVGEIKGTHSYDANRLAVTKTQEGFAVAVGIENAAVVCVYETATDGVYADYVTQKFNSFSSVRASFAFTTVYSSGCQNETYYSDVGLCYAAFLSVTDGEGNTVITYTRATGDRFGREDSDYGKTVTLMELSDYFLNVYRVDGGDVSPFATNKNLRRVVATVGIDATASATGGTLVEKDEAKGTDETRVLSSSLAMTLTVENAVRGVYELRLRANALGEKVGYITVSANGRHYDGRLAAGLAGTSESPSNRAVASTDAKFDSRLFTVLDEGMNTVKITLTASNGSSSNQLGIADVEFVLREEITDGTLVYNAMENLNTEKTTCEYTAFISPSYASDVKTALFSQKAEYYINVSVPIGGTYHLSAMTAMEANKTMTATFYEGDVLVDTNSFTSTASMRGADSSRATVLNTAFGEFDLAAGDYTLYIGSKSQLTLGDIFLTRVEKEETEKTTAFTVLATDMTHSLSYASDSESVILSQGKNLSFKVNVEVPGYYRLDGKFVRNGYIQYLTVASSLQTAHPAMVRIGKSSDAASGTTAPVSDAEKNAAYVDGDCLGFIYLGVGEHTLTVKNVSGGGSLAIYKMSATLVTEQTGGSKYIDAGSYDTELTKKGTSPTVISYNGAVQDRTSSYVYRFTPEKSGAYDLFLGLGCEPGTVTVTVEKASDTTETVYSMKKTFTADMSPYSTERYSFSNTAAAVLETPFDAGIMLEGGTEYLVTVSNANPAITFTDLRFVYRAEEERLETLDLDFTAGGISSDGSSNSADNTYISALVKVPTKGTTLYMTVCGTRAGFLSSSQYAVLVYDIGDGVLDADLASDMTLSGNGYKGRADGRISVACGYTTYKITTTEDNVYLRLSAKALSPDAILVTSDANDVVTVSEEEMKELFEAETVISDLSVTFGKTATVGVTVSGARRAPLLLLAYDAAESLVGYGFVDKNEYTERLTATVSAVDGATVDSIRVVQVASRTNLTQTSNMQIVEANGRKDTVGKGVVAVTEETLLSLSSIDGAFVVHSDEMNTSGSVAKLSDGTLLFTSGTSNYATFTVDAPSAGAYMVDLKFNSCGGFVHYFYIYNTSYAEWNTNGHGEGRYGAAGAASTATTNEDYAVTDAVRYGAFDNSRDAFVYLQKGKNTLKICFTSNVSGVKVGVGSIRFVPSGYDTNLPSVVLPVSQMQTAEEGLENVYAPNSKTNNNGFFLYAGSKIYFDVNIPESGIYDLRGLLSSDGVSVQISSAETQEKLFLPVTTQYATLMIGSCSTTVEDYSFGLYNLQAGEQTLCFEVVDGKWIHFNMLMFYRVADFDESETLSVTQKHFSLDYGTGVFTAELEIYDTLLRRDLAAYAHVTYTTVDGDEGSYEVKAETGGAFHSLPVLTGMAVEGLETVTVIISIYDGTQLLHDMPSLTYTAEEQMRVLVLTDTHYTGTNMTQNVYDYNNEKWLENVLKDYNVYTPEYDVYEWSSDEKLQRVVDDLIMKYKNGEYDMIFILGDQAMTDGIYDKFEKNNIRYEGYIKGTTPVFSDPDKENHMEEFWNHPLNTTTLVTKLFFSQLSENGIPYFVANGNHDYMYEYSDDKSDVDYTEWERLYHYAELFGHRTEEANGRYLRDENDNYIYYSDSDSVNYLVRAIRRNGEFKIVSALSEKDLEAFKEKYAGDGNCYDFYVSEETVGVGENVNDVYLGAYAMVNGFQIDGFTNYTEIGVAKDPVTGVTSYLWQTTRFTYLKDEMVRSMLDMTVENYSQVYYVGHLVGGVTQNHIIDYPNIRGIIYGDVHTEEHYYQYGVPYWVAGNVASCYDIDEYYMLDENGNAVKDNQYYYDRSTNTNKIGNQIWGDFMRHPWSYATVSSHGDISCITREYLPVAYENTHQIRLTYDRVSGIDLLYKRAVADPARFDAHEFLFAVYENGTTVLYRESELPSGVTARRVFVGGDVYLTGKTYFHLCEAYTPNEINAYSFRMDAEGNVYTLSGVLTGEKAVFASTVEGSIVSVSDKNYYICGMSGEVSGHYLYDMNGNFVYVDQNGNLVFYDSVLADGNYIEASIQSQYVLNDAPNYTLYTPPYQRVWYYLDTDRNVVMLDKDGDGKLDAGTYTNVFVVRNEDIADGFATNKDKHNVSGLVTPEIIVNEEGKITKGEGFCYFSYVATYSYADGTAVTGGLDGVILYETDENGDPIYSYYAPAMSYAEKHFG